MINKECFRYAVEKICYLKEDASNPMKWDYEVHPKMFWGEDQGATALRAEKHITTLAQQIEDNIESHEKMCGKFIKFDPVGIHHFGCDEVAFEFEKAVIRLRLVELVWNPQEVQYEAY